jgi:hypothetical protein
MIPRIRGAAMGIALAWASASSTCFAQGGPPLVTDDPGTPGDGNWEINLATIWTGTGNADLLQVPYGDFNYGWGDRIQLKAETGWNFAWLGGSEAANGAASLLVGVKWRFYDDEDSGLTISIYPQYEFRHWFTSRDSDVATPGTRVILPFEASKTIGKVALNPEVGFVHATLQDETQLFYALAASYELEKEREALFEVHGETRLDGNGSELFFNVGSRYAFAESVSLIFAFGHTIVNFPDESPHWLGYLGAQLRL